MIEYGFGRLGFRRIEATVDPENRASIRILEKLGLLFERRGVDEHNLPTIFYAIERTAWEKAR